MKKDIKSLPFEEIETTFQEYSSNKDANKIATATFIEKYRIKENISWLGEQILAYLASEIRWNQDAEGKIIIPKLLEQMSVSKRLQGLWRLLVKTPRGHLMDKQTAKEHTRFCGLVPPFLAAAKEFHNIPYSAWDSPELEFMVEAQLYKAMREPPREIPENILAIRDKGLSYVSKSGAIKSYNPETYYRLTGIEDTELAGVSALAKVMLTQIWCAHPSNRNNLMVLDPWNWDRMPEPLITHEILQPTKNWWE